MVHRGPDDAGEWWSADGRVGFAHRRLSIVDLSAAGHQPMHDFSMALTIVFNGEIYNHIELRKELINLGYVFLSGSDTEVILNAYRHWGTDCLVHLNGAFAFAILDEPNQLVFFARDRVGEKPLFYHLTGTTLHFASELKALFADQALSRRVDLESLDCYLAIGYIPGDHCLLLGYKKLPPAHALIFDLKNGKSKVFRYWQPPELVSHPTTHAGENDLLQELETLLEDAVRRQMVADVPVGVLLSGGVDSSLITAMAVRSSTRVQTFTIGFPGHGKLDETSHARLIANHFGTNHTELMADRITADIFIRLSHQFDEPIVDSSIIPTFMVSQLVRKHCTVALGGDGGDELFGGYEHYSRMLRMQDNLRAIPLNMRNAIASVAENILPVGVMGRNWLQTLGTGLIDGQSPVTSCFDITTRRRLLVTKTGWRPWAEDLMRSRVPKHTDLIQRATRIDFDNYLAEDILVKVDRASLLNSLEVRAPMLDCRMLEFAFGKVPSHLKATKTEKKILLKRLTNRVLPQAFDRQRKQGFSIPLGNWMKDGQIKALFDGVLRDPKCSFDRRTVDGLLRGQDLGRSNGERLFALLMIELWIRKYGATF